MASENFAKIPRSFAPRSFIFPPRYLCYEINLLFPTGARMVELVDTRDLKSRGPGRVRAGSSPAPGTKVTQ